MELSEPNLLQSHLCKGRCVFLFGIEVEKDSRNSTNTKLGGGFNPPEKYSSNWMIFPRGENKKYLKPPPSDDIP